MNQNTIPQPITKGHVKVPVVMQLEALECGAACLTMILAYYGKCSRCLYGARIDCGHGCSDTASSGYEQTIDGSRTGGIGEQAVNFPTVRGPGVE